MNSRKYRKISVLIFLIFVSRGLLIIPSSAYFVKTVHLSFLYLVVFLLTNTTVVVKCLKQYSLCRKLIAVCFFFITSILFSIFYYNFTFVSVFVQGMRFMLLLSIFIYFTLNRDDVLWIMNALFYITLITSLLYIIQGISNLPLLPYDLRRPTSPMFYGIYRYYNIPIYASFFLYISIFANYAIPKKLHTISIYIFMAVTFISLGRTAIFTMFFTIMLISYFQRKVKLYIYLAILMLPLSLVFGSFISDRMDSEGKSNDDMNAVLKLDYDAAANHSENGLTMIYRLAWVNERIEYLAHRPFVEQLYGLGLPNDEDPDVYRKYNFRYGLHTKEGLTVQLRTPDIAWGNFVTCYGLLGTIIYFIFLTQL